MKDACRICAGDLHGNQRRWIFHPAPRVSLRVLLSHVVGGALKRDGRGEFACSKCVFLLERMFRLDGVAARVGLLSLDRLQRLLLEGERLRRGIRGQYRRNNAEDPAPPDPEDSAPPGSGGSEAGPPEADSYWDLIQDDLTHSGFRFWADPDGSDSQNPRRCRGCAALRVPDSDYEAVCRVPRRVVTRSASCGPPERAQEEGLATGVPLWDQRWRDRPLSALEAMLRLLRGSESRPLRLQRDSRLPVLVKVKQDQDLVSPHEPTPGGGVRQELEVGLEAELEAELEEQWLDEYLQWRPCNFQQRKPAFCSCGRSSAAQQDRLRPLWAKIRTGEIRNQELQERLDLVELELRSAREEAEQREMEVQKISAEARSNEAQASDLRQVVEEQNQMLCSLKEIADRSQLQASGSDVVRRHGDVLVLQASLFRAQLELQAGERAQLQAARTLEDQNRLLQRLEDNLQVALQRRRETETHNRELQRLLEEVRTALLEREELLREANQERRGREAETESTITELKTRLQTKEQLIQDFLLLQDENRDALVQKLRQRIRERDRALERTLDDRFEWAEQKEAESRRLQLLLREQDRDLERQRCVLANNQETISSLEVLLRGRALEAEQLSDAWRSVQRQQQDGEERQSHALRERDAIIRRLQGALQASTQEAQDLRCSLQVQSAPTSVLEQLKLHLQLKDRLFQEILADQASWAQEHQDQVQVLLRTISCRDQYIQESAGRVGEVMEEQTGRLQELRRQLSFRTGSKVDSGSELELQEELQAAQEELRLALRREKQNQELSRSQAAREENLRRTLSEKEEVIRDLHRQLVAPPDLPLVERLTQEVQELRESLVQHTRVPGPDRPECGEPSPEDEDEADGSVSSDEDESELKARSEARTQDYVAGCPAGSFEGQGLMEVQQLVEQKKVVERELGGLKAQLEKAGFSSLSEMRKVLLSLQEETRELKHQLTDGRHGDREEELDVPIEGMEEEEEDEVEQWEVSLPQRKKRADELQPRPSSPVAIATNPLQPAMSGLAFPVPQDHQDHREPRGAAVQQDSKADLQDPGYETCGRSENEAERDDTSSPEFDDLEMCTSLDCGSQWWPSVNSSSAFNKGSAQSSAQNSAHGDASLRRLVEDLRSQLTRSQAVIRGLQSRLRSLSTSSDLDPPATRKVNWFQSPPQSGTEEDEGWQSSDGGLLGSSSQSDSGLQELASRVNALEDQLRSGGAKSVSGDRKCGPWPGKVDALIQAQARELSHLRQRLKEGRGLCSILSQHLGETTKAFEELLRANDVDFYMGQSFREQLAQSGALAQRVGAKISSRDPPEEQEEKTELLAIRLSKELQQKDKVIESLRAKLNLHHHPHCSDTPSGSHALSDTTDQSDRISYVSDERGSTNDNLEMCSEVDAASELAQKDSTERLSPCGTGSRHLSVPPSLSSSHTPLSWLSCPSMHCTSSPPNAAAMGQTVPDSSSVHFPPSFFSTQGAPLPPNPHPTAPRSRYQGNEGVGFSLAEVHQELQTLQRQLGDAAGFSSPQSRHIQGHPDSTHPRLSLHGFQPSISTGSSTLKAGNPLLGSSALWDLSYGGRPLRLGADLSSGSSGYQSGPSHTGSDLMMEHLKEIRGLRQRLDDSIRTNDRLRQQLEEKLACSTADKGAPTNIYIQGLDSVGRLSSDMRLLKEENLSLQERLKEAREGSKEAEQLRQAALVQRASLKEAELKAERWAGQIRDLQAEAESHNREINQLKKERLRNQEDVKRLQHEVSVLQQQLCESRHLVHALQCELQVYQREGGASSDSAGQTCTAVTFDSSRLDPHPGARRRIFSGAAGHHGNVPPLSSDCSSVPSSPEADSAPQGWDATTSTRHGRHAVGRLDAFTALQQQIQEGGDLLGKMEAALCSPSVHPGSVRTLLSDLRTLGTVLQEAGSQLRAFWIEGEAEQARPISSEVATLRLRLLEQERALRDAMERLRSSNRTKDHMENFIVSQLSRTQDVLRRAKTNLQVNQLRISSLCHAPSSSSSSSFSSSSGKGENSGACHGPGIMTTTFIPSTSIVLGVAH
ncbi:myomegalin isoform X3 [Antennarius striatus]|uniref:myomegalin isoform X3 n=1 Tax=Antennarius striatus TaxID=241820 RepID=UPI0035AF2D56